MAVITSASAEASITLIREGRSGAPSSLAFYKKGWPYVSMVTYAMDVGGAPIFLFSDLANHCQNIIKDRRSGLLIEKTSALKNPQMGLRISVLGKIKKQRVNIMKPDFWQGILSPDFIQILGTLIFIGCQ